MKTIDTKLKQLAKALLIFPLLTGVSHATAFFSDFGANQSYDTGNGQFLGDDGAGNNDAQAAEFTAATSGGLADIQLALSAFGGQSDSIVVTLDNNNGGQPGGILESFSFSAATLGNFGDNNQLVVLNSVLNPTLTAGSSYWITISTDVANSLVWNNNNIGSFPDTAELQSVDGGASWLTAFGNTLPAFQLDPIFVPAPEPGIFPLMAMGYFSLSIGARRKRSIS